jgi:putative tricarboxylic transport membrane protein
VHILIPMILLLSGVGSYAIRGRMFDVYTMIIVGVLGYLLSKLGFHPGPIALGLILGPIVEAGLVSSLALVRATDVFTVFFSRPISLVFIALTVISIAWLAVSRWRENRQEAEMAAVEMRERADD